MRRWVDAGGRVGGRMTLERISAGDCVLGSGGGGSCPHPAAHTHSKCKKQR